jgi:glucose 1-dehydrogenase
MVRQGSGGTIITISSVHEDLAFPGYAAYCAAKGGLRMLCRTLALELAPHKINVINVAPGAIATPINAQTLASPAKRAELEREIPLGRLGQPEEVARLVAYLASGGASYITGTTVCIDGGLMRQTGSL